MPLNTNIPLSVRPLEIEDPMDSLRKAADVRTAQANSQLAPLRVQNEMQQLQNEQKLGPLRIQEAEARVAQLQDSERLRKEDNDADAAIQGALSESAGDWEKARKSVLGKVPTRAILRHDEEHIKFQRSMHEMGEEKRKEVAARNQIVGAEALGLKLLPQEERAAALPGAIDRVRAAGIDLGDIDASHLTDETLDSIIARTNYIGEAIKMSNAKSLEESRAATAKKAEEDASAKKENDRRAGLKEKRSDVARKHLTVRTQEQHDAFMKNLKDKDADLYAEYENLTDFGETTKHVIQQMAMTENERVMERDKDADNKRADERESRIGKAKPGAKTREWDDIEQEKNEAFATASAISDSKMKVKALNAAQERYEKAITKNGGNVTASPRWALDAKGNIVSPFKKSGGAPAGASTPEDSSQKKPLAGKDMEKYFLKN